MDFKKGIGLRFVLIVVTVIGLTENASAQQRTAECKNSGGAYAWLSCLIAKANKNLCNPSGCARYAGTEFEKDLTCTFQKQRCGGCVPQYKLNATEVTCNALQQTGYECPPGVRMEVCNLDACVATVCRPYLTAPCRNNFCGGCFAEYDVDGQWRRCPIEVFSIQPDNPVIPGQTLDGFSDVAFASTSAGSVAVPQTPIRSKAIAKQPIRASTCPNGELPWDCPADVCTNAYCSAYPQAKCRINNCGGCSPEFTTGIYVIQDCNSRECPKNTLEMVCKDDPCKYSTCKKYEDKNPVCRPSRCGGCRAMWYVDGREVDCYKQYGVDVPCPNGEMRQKCPKTTCRFKHCPVDRSITCVINNCGGCHREYHKLTETGRTITVDESRCQGWWNFVTERKKKKFSSKKRPLPRPVNEISPNELDPMARRNNERTINSVDKFETSPKNNLNLGSQAKAIADVGVPHKSAMESSIVELAPPPPPQLPFNEPPPPPQLPFTEPPPQLPVEPMSERTLGVQQFMPKPSFPELPADLVSAHILENPLMNPPETFVEYPTSNGDVPRSDVAVDYPQERGVAPLVSEPVKTVHSMDQNLENIQTIENPLMFDQPSASSNTRKTEVIENPLLNDKSQPHPQKQDRINVEVLHNPLSNTRKTEVIENPLLNDKRSQLHPKKQDRINVEVIHNPLTNNQRPPSNINVAPLNTDALPSVPASDLSVQILDIPQVRAQEPRRPFDEVQTPVPTRVIQPVVRDRINVEFIDTPTRAFPLKRGRNRRINSKRKGADSSKMNFWKTDMQLPSAFFQFMLQGMGFHGIPLEGIQKK
ncbi:uncharacterized protein LOC125662626 [Ostrea edulis]|uniref:uncharacterized protein LOC125662626 n=1 Tax=Ostrea edulis TaxID=37623 RepID=UPI0024AEBC62|nr:uncharacterized protein LOC125662626 [Ostrea edulis]